MRTLVGTLPPDPDPVRQRNRRLGLLDFLRQVRAEGRKIVAPNPSELVTYTAVSLLWATGMTAFVVGLDVMFTKGLFRILSR